MTHSYNEQEYPPGTGGDASELYEGNYQVAATFSDQPPPAADEDPEFNRLYDQHFFTNAYYENNFAYTDSEYPPDQALASEAGSRKKPVKSQHSDNTEFSVDDNYSFDHTPTGLPPGDQSQYQDYFIDHFYNPAAHTAPPHNVPVDDYDRKTDFIHPGTNEFIPIVSKHFADVRAQELSSDSEKVNIKRKLSKKAPIVAVKKENLMSKPKVVRQSSTSSIPTKTKFKNNITRPGLNKSYSYTSESKPKSKSLYEMKKKPSFRLDLEKTNTLFKFHEFSNSTSSVDDAYNKLQIVENDLEFTTDHDLNDPHRIVTPSMKPPGTEQSDYFEDILVPTSFDSFSNHNDRTLNLHSGHDANDYYDTNEYLGITIKQEDHGLFSNSNSQSNSQSNSRSNSPPRAINDIKQAPSSLDLSPLPFGTQEASPHVEYRPKLRRTSSTQSASSVNSHSSGAVPTTLVPVSGSTASKKKKASKGAVCSVCGKFISRDLSRHIRIHDHVGRFRCVYPKEACSHKTGNFNRPYDYKKHLLHFHFVFDDPKGKAANNLTDKLPLLGNCKACGFRNTANEWLENHVFTSDDAKKCPYLDKKYALRGFSC